MRCNRFFRSSSPLEPCLHYRLNRCPYLRILLGANSGAEWNILRRHDHAGLQWGFRSRNDGQP
jgi:hypothetical protein